MTVHPESLSYRLIGTQQFIRSLARTDTNYGYRSLYNLKQTILRNKKKSSVQTMARVFQFQTSDSGDTSYAYPCNAHMSTGSLEDQGSTSAPTATCRHGSLEEAPQVHSCCTGSMLLAESAKWRGKHSEPKMK